MPYFPTSCEKWDSWMSLALKPNHATVKAYYETLNQFGQLYIDHEGAVRSAFQTLSLRETLVSWRATTAWNLHGANLRNRARHLTIS